MLMGLWYKINSVLPSKHNFSATIKNLDTKLVCQWLIVMKLACKEIAKMFSRYQDFSNMDKKEFFLKTMALNILFEKVGLLLIPSLLHE